MNRSESRGPPEPDRDTISINSRLHFLENNIRAEIKAALWYCIHCIDKGKDELKLDMRQMQERSSAEELGYCPICIETLTSETMIRCTGNSQHKICRSCVERMIKAEVWEKKKHEFTCFADPQCEARYSPRQYNYVDSQTLQEVGRLDQDAQIQAAGLTNLHQCPYCHFKMDYHPSPGIITFWCPADGCKKTSCILCGGSGHHGQTCAEQRLREIRQGDVAVLNRTVEEVMTRAVKRQCK